MGKKYQTIEILGIPQSQMIPRLGLRVSSESTRSERNQAGLGLRLRLAWFGIAVGLGYVRAWFSAALSCVGWVLDFKDGLDKMEGRAKVALTGLGGPVGTGTWLGCLEQCQAKQDFCKQNQCERWIKAPFAFSGQGRRLPGCSACALDVVDGRDRQTHLLSRPSSGNGCLLFY